MLGGRILMRKKKYKFRGTGHLYMKLLFVYIVFLIICISVLYAQNSLLGLIGAVALGILGIITIIVYAYSKKTIGRYVNDNEIEFSRVQRQLMENLSVPYVLLDFNGSIRWYNKQFQDLFPDLKLNSKNINTIIKDMNRDQFPKDSNVLQKDISIDDKYYLVNVNLLEVNVPSSNEEDQEAISTLTHMYSISFSDITQLVELQQENIDQQTIVSLMFIDNYEEVMQSVDEVRRPLLEAMIYKKLNDLAVRLEGVVRRLEKDKYIFLFPNKNLLILQNEKFEILDDIRKINIGNDLPVTLSIGIGIHAENLAQSMEFARAAIDLALGRGGDQAVIKNKDRYSFYGGKTKGVEKSTRVKARIKAYAFRELIEESDRVLIMGHKNPDLDCLGAALGVYRGATQLDRPAHIVINSNYSSVKKLYDRVVEDKDYEEDMFIDNIEAIGYSGDKTLLVIVDVNRPSIVECPELLELSKNIVVFDHHRTSVENIKNTVISYVEPYASSASEMITEILQYMIDKIKLKPVEADGLFAGIALDTKNFSVKTGVRTFEAAALLRRHGADSVRVRELFKNDMDAYKAKTTVVRDAEIYNDNIAISVCPRNVDNGTVITAQAADELLSIHGISASFVLTEVEGKIVISARSLGELNVQLIMEKLGGGGHLTVAGAQLEDDTIDSAIEKLKLAIDEYEKRGE